MNSQDTAYLLSIIMQMGLHGGKAQSFAIVGPPGIGKTQGIEALSKAIAAKLGSDFPCEIWSGPQIQAEDAAGLPVPDLESGTTRLLPLRLGESVLKSNAGVLCIDEFGSISPPQEAAFLNLLQGGRLGERILPSSVALGALLNPEDHASNARMLSAPAANRFIWLNWTLDPSTWLDYMSGGPGFGAKVGILKPDWEERFGPQARSLITSYIKRNTARLHAMPEIFKASGPWPSPRSWEAASRILAALLSLGERKESDLCHTAISGCVGDGDGDAFMSWLVSMNLPDPEELLASPKKASKLLPERNDQLAVCMETLATAALMQHPERKDRWETAWEILSPVFEDKNDVGLAAASMLAADIPKGAAIPNIALKVYDIFQKAGLA